MREFESNNSMESRRCALIPLAALLVLASAGYVQGQLRTRVEEVVVPVSVRDENGAPVTGLKKDDFTILEDGRPQSISNFSIDPLPLSAAIVVDDGMSGTSLKRLVPLFNVLTSGFTPEDEMASFRYDHFVWKLSDFTHDPAAIQKSFGEIAQIAERRPAQGEPGAPLAAGPEWLQSIAGLFSIGSNGAPNPIPSGADRPKPVPTSRVLHDAIHDAAMALRSRPADRRRMILIISDGQVNGANAHSLDENTNLLLQNDIQVYAVSTDFALLEGGLGVLGSYARATGGDVYGGGSAGDMETAFTAITEQARHQYVLHYVSNNEASRGRGIFREIAVRTTPSYPKVTHRRGYIQYPN